MGEVELSAGVHDVVLRYSAANVSPGSGGEPFPVGPLVLGRDAIGRPLVSLPSREAGSLCGKTLDWVEAVR